MDGSEKNAVQKLWRGQDASIDAPLVLCLRHPLSDPNDLLDFVELTGFMDDWKDLGLNDEADLATLQITIMLAPKGSPVVSGTGGLRKLRFSPPSWNRGKRGALRVGYVYYEEFGVVLLVVVYAKSDRDDLSAKAKQIIKAEIEQQRTLLSKGLLD